MKSRFILLLMAAMTIITAHAQEELTVKSFLPLVNDLTARTEIRLDNSGEPCALIKVVFADKDATFECGNLASMIVGDVTYHTNEYWVYLAAGLGGAKHLKVKHPNYQTLDITFSEYGFRTLEPQTTYTLVIAKPQIDSKFKTTNLYLQPAGQFGMLNAVGVTIGGYLHNFNIEAYYMWGLSSSEEIYWISAVDGDYTSYTYTPHSFGFNVGYGLLLGERFRLTPQIGIGTVSLKGEEKIVGRVSPNATDGYALNMGLGVKTEFYISKHIAIGLAPSYSLAVKKSDLFNQVANISSDIKNFGSGFNAKVLLTINFCAK